MRRPPDAAGIEQALAIVVHLVAVDGELVDAGAFEEERPLLLQEGLEHAEIQDGRILLDLPEIGSYRAVEREVRGEAVFEIGARIEALVAVESPVLGSRGILRHGVRHHVESPRRRDAVDAREVTELRNEADLRRPVRRPGNALLVAFDVAPDREAEGVGGRRRIAQLGKRNRELRRPSERVHARGHVPDAVPRAVLVVVVIDGIVALHAPRADGELETRAAIVEGIDHDLQLVGGRAHVASREYTGNLRGLGVVGADEGIEVVVVERGLRCRPESRRSALDRGELREVRDERGRVPDGVVGAPVDHHGRRRADSDGTHRRSRRPRERYGGAFENAGHCESAGERGHGGGWHYSRVLGQVSPPKGWNQEVLRSANRSQGSGPVSGETPEKVPEVPCPSRSNRPGCPARGPAARKDRAAVSESLHGVFGAKPTPSRKPLRTALIRKPLRRLPMRGLRSSADISGHER